MTQSSAETGDLWHQFVSAADEGTRLSAWIGLQCAWIHGAIQGVVVLGPADTGPFVPQAIWPLGGQIEQALASAAESALASKQAVAVTIPADANGGLPSGAIAHPIEVDGRMHGIVALRLTGSSEAQLGTALRSLQWGIGWLESMGRSKDQRTASESQERLTAVLDFIATVLEHEKFEAAARALATDVAMRLNCDRVTIGLVRDGRSQVLALSHSAQFGKQMNLLRAIGLAMDEAIDQKAVVLHPESNVIEPVVTRDHEHLARGHGCDNILTVPFAASPDFVGAITLERSSSKPFDTATIELMQSVMAVSGRMLDAKRSSERPLYQQFGAMIAKGAGWILGWRHMKVKFLVLSLVSAFCFLGFSTGLWRVSATANLEGAIRRSLVAPFDGYVMSAPQRAGDVVGAQSLLASLDDRDLRLERTRWASQYAQYAKQYDEAIAVRDRAKAQVAQSQSDQARAQVALIDEQITRSSIRAPFAGLIVKGDLSQALGSAVKRGEALFEIAPLNAYRVIVQVDESEISGIKIGQRGSLVLTSIANENFDFSVSKITPVTIAREGRNYFRVEGILDRTSDRLRPGMEGVGKIEIDERRWIWILTYRLVNWWRIFVWTWWP